MRLRQEHRPAESTAASFTITCARPPVPNDRASSTLAVRREMLRAPDHVRFMTDSNILQITSAMDVQPDGDPYTSLIKESAQTCIKTATPGIYLVDSFPMRKRGAGKQSTPI